jgi:diacylglycerol kinase
MSFLENKKNNTKQNIKQLLLSRKESASNAFRGIVISFQTQLSVQIQFLFFLISFFLGVVFNISLIEWCFVILSSGLMIVMEVINTAFEIDIDLTSPEYHPYARDTKDVSAGAVFITFFIFVIINSIIFLPKILLLI